MTCAVTVYVELDAGARGQLPLCAGTDYLSMQNRTRFQPHQQRRQMDGAGRCV
eukprot:CAMPEP_0170190592 /NCGR_PEP_ID=MMETSP0040_2-20121228/49692_1 /TAXON_ID=641309 /ORGANISM="Lotharella oceanica, Strain CCMP622" /LENGTH=52 /DNA_ID=CAMNT_0010438491 /DNA_START=32 /DNA_END=190 /DNA_ORIENTATION=-